MSVKFQLSSGIRCGGTIVHGLERSRSESWDVPVIYCSPLLILVTTHVPHFNKGSCSSCCLTPLMPLPLVSLLSPMIPFLVLTVSSRPTQMLLTSPRFIVCHYCTHCGSLAYLCWSHLKPNLLVKPIKRRSDKCESLIVLILVVECCGL